MRFKKPKRLSAKQQIKKSTSVDVTATVGRVPAYCPHCGVLSAVPGIFGGKATVTLSNCFTTCPQCGSTANMLDGTFAIEGNALKLLSGPKFTADALRVLAGIIERAARKEITPEELEKQVSEIDEDFGTIVKEAYRKGGPGIAFLLLLVLFLKGCHFNLDAKVDLNTLWNQIVSAHHGVIYDPSKSDHGIGKTESNGSSDRGHATSKDTRKEVR